MQFYINTEYKQSYKFYMEYLCKLIITNMATMRTPEVIFDKFNVERIFTQTPTLYQNKIIIKECVDTFT
jgi:hypothetical protein